MFRSLLLASSLALLAGCASNTEPMRTGITPNPRYNPPGPTSPSVNASNPAIVGESAWQSEATKWIGAPFRPGGNNREGMDALGLIRRMYENVARIKLTSNIDELARIGVAISRDQLRPGDILFFGKDAVSGAGIFLGDNRFVTATPNFGVAYAQLTDPQFGDNYRTARRILR